MKTQCSKKLESMLLSKTINYLVLNLEHYRVIIQNVLCFMVLVPYCQVESVIKQVKRN